MTRQVMQSWRYSTLGLKEKRYINHEIYERQYRFWYQYKEISYQTAVEKLKALAASDRIVKKERDRDRERVKLLTEHIGN